MIGVYNPLEWLALGFALGFGFATIAYCFIIYLGSRK